MYNLQFPQHGNGFGDTDIVEVKVHQPSKRDNGENVPDNMARREKLLHVVRQHMIKCPENK